MNDKAWRGIIIWSIPPTNKWFPVIPSLYMMSTSAKIISTLFTHEMILSLSEEIYQNTRPLPTHQILCLLPGQMKRAPIQIVRQRNDLLTWLPTAIGPEVGRKVNSLLILAKGQKQMPSYPPRVPGKPLQMLLQLLHLPAKPNTLYSQRESLIIPDNQGY